MELQTLIQSFFMLSGSITETENERTIKLTRNEKEPEMMEKLELGLNALNSFGINYIRGCPTIICLLMLFYYILEIKYFFFFSI
jgi:hypothetical protein